MGGVRATRIYDVAVEDLSSHPIMFSFGIGDDLDAEVSFIERYGGSVYAFDPTPRTREWIEKNRPENNFEFESLALSEHDGDERFFFSENKEFISGSIRKENVDWQIISDHYTIVHCERLKTIMKRLKIDKIDYLKLCIEGAEYEVVEDILKSGLNIGQIAIAFCGYTLPDSLKRNEQLYKLMKQYGYKTLQHKNMRRITFIR